MNAMTQTTVTHCFYYKHKIKTLIQQAALKAYKQGELRSSTIQPFAVDEPKTDAHGDFATNFAMTAAAVQKMGI